MNEKRILSITIRPYCRDDYAVCCEIFDANCPEFFVPSERPAYAHFLAGLPEKYEVCEVRGQVLGAFGLLGNSQNEKRLNWIMVHPTAQGMGVGSTIMERVICLGRASETKVVGIATSPMIAPFFEKYGATTKSIIKDGHGVGKDRVDMVFPL